MEDFYMNSERKDSESNFLYFLLYSYAPVKFLVLSSYPFFCLPNFLIHSTVFEELPSPFQSFQFDHINRVPILDHGNEVIMRAWILQRQCQKTYLRIRLLRVNSDQPVHSLSLISISTGRLWDSHGCKISSCGQ